MPPAGRKGTFDGRYGCLKCFCFTFDKSNKTAVSGENFLNIAITDLWIDTGFHCGEGLEVLVDDEWVQTRMEMNLAREWYLVGTPYCGDLEYVQARIPG